MRNFVAKDETSRENTARTAGLPNVTLMLAHHL